MIVYINRPVRAAHKSEKIGKWLNSQRISNIILGLSRFKEEFRQRTFKTKSNISIRISVNQMIATQIILDKLNNYNIFSQPITKAINRYIRNKLPVVKTTMALLKIIISFNKCKCQTFLLFNFI